MVGPWFGTTALDLYGPFNLWIGCVWFELHCVDVEEVLFHLHSTDLTSTQIIGVMFDIYDS